MKRKSIDKENLKAEIFSLMDEVQKVLESGVNVDDFLDETTIFDEWECKIPEREFPIFVITVLNNIRKETIIDTILIAILGESIKKNIGETAYPKKKKLISHLGKLPFN
tara:strand:+ start:386 stop:712 length:327 start_codon:yes stop_codon:yes gene_type:complete